MNIRNRAEQLRAEYLAGLIKRAASSLAKTASSSVAHWRQRRDTIHQLGMLDNRTLQDIGVCRGDIYTVADNPPSASGKRHY